MFSVNDHIEEMRSDYMRLKAKLDGLEHCIETRVRDQVRSQFYAHFTRESEGFVPLKKMFFRWKDKWQGFFQQIEVTCSDSGVRVWVYFGIDEHDDEDWRQISWTWTPSNGLNLDGLSRVEEVSTQKGGCDVQVDS